MLTDEERLQRSRETVDQMQDTVRQMREDNERWFKARAAERAAEDLRKAQGKWGADDWMLLLARFAIGFMLLMFCVLIYTTLPTIINAVIKATTQWQALLR
ncbi:hypothetical protein [Caballeronia concitans]|uniref:Uncharacterized protein n=1 Tax=Caballeronia concitans TaxID=1777133 RepID=A0A658R4Y8_9BURK|nr:hypothetical protein [Caballeronia concitans]SAL51391.1 hypothetical protein AWB72_05438 [Caballeronia concitans]